MGGDMIELNKIYNEDCLEGMKKIDDNSIDAVITDPPYGISFMNKKWDYEVPCIEIWAECLRVLKPGGHLLAFAGTRTQHRMAVNIEDAGFEIRDMIAWIYGSGFPKSFDIGKQIDKLQDNEREIIGIKQHAQKDFKDNLYAQDPANRHNKKVFGYGEEVLTKGTSEWEGYGTALKPAMELISLCRKPISEKTIAENVLKWGTGGLNIDECRVEYRDEHDKEGARYGSVTPSNIYGWANTEKKNLGDKNILVNMQGRFPANVIHDGSDEVLAGFPETKSGARKGGDDFKLGRYENQKGAWGLKKGMDCEGSNGSAARYFYCAKASKAERGEGNNHPTVKPLALIQYLLKLASRENHIILDPFLGSGTTVVAAIQSNRRYIGFEISKEYFTIAETRTKEAKKQMNLF